MTIKHWGCCGNLKPKHDESCQYYDQLGDPTPIVPDSVNIPNDKYLDGMRSTTFSGPRIEALAKEAARSDASKLSANAIQIGGEHYKKGGEEHWDRAWRLKYDPFQYIITKWVERWRDKGGVEDLKKAQHAIQKYIEVVSKDSSPPPS